MINPAGDRAAEFGHREDAGVFQDTEVAGDDGEVDIAALGDLADAARAGALDEAAEDAEAGGIGEGPEEERIEEVVDGSAAGEGLLGSERGSFAYLRHYASIGRWFWRVGCSGVSFV